MQAVSTNQIADILDYNNNESIKKNKIVNSLNSNYLKMFEGKGVMLKVSPGKYKEEFIIG